MKSQHILKLMLVAVLAFGLSGCLREQGKNNEDTAPRPTVDNPVI
jgi:hypothetical protein